MRRIVLDTNCLIQIIPKRSPFRSVWEAYLGGDYVICVSSEILDEYHEILAQLANAEVADNIVAVIVNSPYTEFFDPRFRFFLITDDPDDNKFVDCAITAQAEYVVTNDKHFDELSSIPFPKVDVLSLLEFKKLIKV